MDIFITIKKLFRPEIVTSSAKKCVDVSFIYNVLAGPTNLVIPKKKKLKYSIIDLLLGKVQSCPFPFRIRSSSVSRNGTSHQVSKCRIQHNNNPALCMGVKKSLFN